jgi:succinate-semialdehyde dehydrogenase/glutarate-semialdehyde dehydrogenase
MTTLASDPTAAANVAPSRRSSAANHVPHGLLVAGEWQPAAGGTMTVVNPATERVIADVADAHRALRAAADAQAAWAATPARNRSEILYRTYELMVERTELLAEVMTLEMGKPLWEARGEVDYAAELIRWFAEEAVRIDGGYAHRPDGAARNILLKQPVGPCLLIVPWNFPLAMGARKVGPAIAAGCTSILKPAPQTPLSSLAFAQLLSEAGLPPGVVNVLPTAGRVRSCLRCSTAA